MAQHQSVRGLIVAVGHGQQLSSGAETAFLGIGSRPALAHSLMAFDQCSEIESMAIMVARDRMEAAESMVRRFGCGKEVHVVAGFLSRRASIRAGLQAVEAEGGLVVIHDVVRPCITPEQISSVIAAARRYGHGVTATRILDAVGLADGRALRADRVCDDGAAWAIQTPQCYREELLVRLLDAADKKNLKVEDEAAALPLLKEAIRLVPAASANIRLSTPDDIALASNLLI